MTALRPERDGAPYDEYDEYAYGGAQAYDGADAFEAAVDQLADPLSDPLPGQQALRGESHSSPWFRVAQSPEPPSAGRQERHASGDDPLGYASDWHGSQEVPSQPSYEEQAASYGQEGYARPYTGPQDPSAAAPAPSPRATPAAAAGPVLPLNDGASVGADGETVGLRIPHPRPVLDDETVGLRTEDTRLAATGGADGALSAGSAQGATAGATAAPPPAEGRAARRRAAKRGGGRHSAASRTTSQEAASQGASGDAAEAASKPLTRLEARRAERARKPSPAVLASRALGEVFITTGVLMLLFVTYQLWWTNIRAHQQTDDAAHTLKDDWANGKRNPGVFEPGQGFAIMHIPKLDVVVPIAEGIDKQTVLDRGMAGHYGKDSIPTAMPSAKTGNFGVAGHRNTHGEPFRYINRLQPGDPIVVETQDAYYVYKMASILPVTSPKNTSVLDPIPPGSGFTKPGRYITLTTCTPEFTSTYRMIVWGKMVEERPRSKGKPDALVE
ncbi:class E sortase [Streptomyces himalayensis]|uniref:Class E sortase n=1 Tax=Streptomyces himalayensis subsp. himalayensis TaxID=2756131 RepID=A0A7W0DHY5_9ACTN|nr:class E sortase [Streptomyces himalayensis]MBA2945353.1 class E sortase [Streptomyces himalayensis subsp. himalayensis]